MGGVPSDERVRSGHILHGHEELFAVLNDIKNGHHVRIGEAGHRAGFVRERHGLPCQVSAERFERDTPVEPVVARQVDDADAARAERRLNNVVATRVPGVSTNLGD
jgi:hypothetical protein